MKKQRKLEKILHKLGRAKLWRFYEKNYGKNAVSTQRSIKVFNYYKISTFYEHNNI